MSAEPQAGGSGRSAQTPRPDPSLTVPEGLVVVDKPKGWTSHDVVGRMRRLCGTRKVGHAGTLDPMATGVLIVGVGRGTKLLTHLVGADKTYEATIRLGATTVTEDAEGELTGTADAGAVAAVTDEQIRAAVAELSGPMAELVPAAQPGGYVTVKLDNGGQLRSRTVILATGARWREMNVPGEQEYRGRGVAYCPHCDGPLFKGKRVAVIGTVAWIIRLWIA